MVSLKKYFTKRKEDSFVKDNLYDYVFNLERLAMDFLDGISSNDQIWLWQGDSKKLHDALNRYKDERLSIKAEMLNDIFYKYLLKHYPDRDLLLKHYGFDREYIKKLRGSLYYEMLVLTLEQIPKLLPVSTDIEKDINLHKELKRYIVADGSNIVLTEKGAQLYEEELFQLIMKLKPQVPDFFSENRRWHTRVENLHTFKFD